MYPEPHIPSAPTGRARAGDCNPSKQALLVLCSSVLLFAVSLSVSVKRQADMQCEREKPAETETNLVTTGDAEHKAEPRFSTRTHPTRLP